MSRIGKRPIVIPKGVTVKSTNGKIEVKGPKGTLALDVPSAFKVNVTDNEISVERPNDHKDSRARHGLYRALIQNMVIGNTEGFTKKLVLIGVGYRAKVQGKVLNLSLGYSHPVEMPIPSGIEVKVDEKTNTIEISGNDKQQVGQFAANVRAKRPVEPYKGKGVRYEGERVIMKAGKAAGK